MCFGNRDIDQNVGLENIVENRRVLQDNRLWIIGRDIFIGEHEHHFPAGRFDLFPDAADLISLWGRTTKGKIHHLDTAGPGFKGHFYQRPNHPGVGGGGILVGMVGYADVGLDDHAGPFGYEPFHAAQGSQSPAHQCFGFAARCDNQVGYRRGRSSHGGRLGGGRNRSWNGGAGGNGSSRWLHWGGNWRLRGMLGG